MRDVVPAFEDLGARRPFDGDRPRNQNAAHATSILNGHEQIVKSGVLAAHDPAAFQHLGEDAMVVAPPTLLGSMLGLERHHVLGDVDRLPEVPAEPEGDADIELVERVGDHRGQQRLPVGQWRSSDRTEEGVRRARCCFAVTSHEKRVPRQPLQCTSKSV